MGHILRMDEAQLHKMMYGELIYGAGTSGGQKKRYKNQLNNLFKTVHSGMKLFEAMMGHFPQLKDEPESTNPVTAE